MKSHEDVASKAADDRRTRGIYLFAFGDKVRAGQESRRKGQEMTWAGPA